MSGANWVDDGMPWGPGATYFESQPGRPFAGPPRTCPRGGGVDRCCVFSYTWPPCAEAKRLLLDERALERSMRRQVRHIDWGAVLGILLAIIFVVALAGVLIMHPGWSP